MSFITFETRATCGAVPEPAGNAPGGAGGSRSIVAPWKPRSLRFALVAGALFVAACANGVSETNTGASEKGPFWQGNTCFARNKSGQLVRVAPSNCPPRAETEAPAGGGTATTTQ